MASDQLELHDKFPCYTSADLMHLCCLNIMALVMVAKITLPRKLAYYNLPDETFVMGLSFGLDSVCKYIGHDVNLSF